MRKFVAASVGVLALTLMAWSAMPAGKAMAQTAPAAPAAGCFEDLIECVRAAAHDAWCCRHPDSAACAEKAKEKVLDDEAAEKAREKASADEADLVESCKGEFKDALDACLAGDGCTEPPAAAPAPAAPAAGR